MLVIDPDTHAVGPLRLGDPIEKAEAVGNPNRALGKGGNQTLEFDGYELQFSEGKLVCFKAGIDEDSAVNVRDIQLTRAVKPLDVQVWFGEPASDSGGPNGLRWIDFEREGATLALEFDSQGLSCVQLYAEGYA